MKREDLPEHFCPVPFTSLIYSQEGRVRVCRDKWTEIVGQVEPGADILEHWNGEKLRAWRREFLDGRPKICKSVIGHRNCHLWHEDLLGDVELAEIQSKPPVVLSPQLNGKCNLRCVMCDIWKRENGYYDETRFWEQGPTKIFPYIKQLEMFSGEPFVQKDTFRMIEEVSKVNPKCVWTFYTNGHWKLNDAVTRALDKIEISRIHFSIDSLDPENFAKIRLDGDLAKVLAALNDMRVYANKRASHGRGFSIGLQFVVQRKNWHEVQSVVEYCLANELVLFLLYAYHPERETLSNIPDEEKIPVLDSLFKAAVATQETQVFSMFRALFDTLDEKNKEAYRTSRG